MGVVYAYQGIKRRADLGYKYTISAFQLNNWRLYTYCMYVVFSDHVMCDCGIAFVLFSTLLLWHIVVAKLCSLLPIIPHCIIIFIVSLSSICNNTYICQPKTAWGYKKGIAKSRINSGTNH